MNFASLRIGKIDQGTETAAHNHNLRASLTKDEINVNRSLSNKNELLLGRTDTIKAINEKIESLKLKTAVRKDANRAIEFVMSASPEHFYDFEKAGITREDWDNITISNLGEKKYWEKLSEIKKFTIKENVEKWKKDILKWVESDEDLKNNVINFVIHDDEKTLHAHLIVTPVVDGKLTAKKFWTPEKSANWQATYAKATGLKKGISSDVKHQDKETYELKQAAKRGYIKGKKAGYTKGKKEGYEVGYQAGLEGSKKLGSKVANMYKSMVGEFHKPTMKLVSDTEEKIKKKDEELKRLERLVKSSKNEADNRVTGLSNDVRKLSELNKNLMSELDEKDKRLEELHRQLQAQNKLKSKYKI